MNNDFLPLDILFLAAIAGYLFYRLYNVLGQRNDDEMGPQAKRKNSNNVIPLRDHKNQWRGPTIEHESTDVVDFGQVLKVDPGFNAANFLKGAKIAFEMILEAFREGDKEALKLLLAPLVYKRFLRSIAQREKAGEVWDHSLLRIKSTEITQARVQEGQVFVTVQFISEQIQVIRDKNDQIIEGDPNQIDTISDLWTFSRNATSQDPNWQLFQTETPT